MATTWTLKRERIADRALELIGKKSIEQAARPALRAFALESLDGLLKSLPHYGYSWPKASSARASLFISPGLQQVALPADYYGSPSIRIMADEIRAGFDLVNSTTLPGAFDTGQAWTVYSGVWGISAGYLYLTAAASGGLGVNTGVYDGEVGVTLGVNTGSEAPTLSFRAVNTTNFLYFTNISGVYYLYEMVAGASTLLKTYTVTPAAGDIISVRFIGPSIVATINGAEQAAYSTTRFMTTGSSIGLGCSNTTSRFKNFYFGTGQERECALIPFANFDQIENHLSTATYPDYACIDNADNIRFSPLTTGFIRFVLSYQSIINDTEANTAPNLATAWFLGLCKGVAVESAIGMSGPVIDRLKQEWAETRALGVMTEVDPGKISFTFED